MLALLTASPPLLEDSPPTQVSANLVPSETASPADGLGGGSPASCRRKRPLRAGDWRRFFTVARHGDRASRPGGGAPTGNFDVVALGNLRSWPSSTAQKGREIIMGRWNWSWSGLGRRRKASLPAKRQALRKTRNLLIEPLECRQLLSVAPALPAPTDPDRRPAGPGDSQSPSERRPAHGRQSDDYAVELHAATSGSRSLPRLGRRAPAD